MFIPTLIRLWQFGVVMFQVNFSVDSVISMELGIIHSRHDNKRNWSGLVFARVGNESPGWTRPECVFIDADFRFNDIGSIRFKVLENDAGDVVMFCFCFDNLLFDSCEFTLESWTG